MPRAAAKATQAWVKLYTQDYRHGLSFTLKNTGMGLSFTLKNTGMG